MQRRKFLTTAGLIAAVGLAGCEQSDNVTTIGTSTDTAGDPSVTPPPLHPQTLTVSARDSYKIAAGEEETYDTADVAGALTVNGTLNLT